MSGIEIVTANDEVKSYPSNDFNGNDATIGIEDLHLNEAQSNNKEREYRRNHTNARSRKGSFHGNNSDRAPKNNRPKRSYDDRADSNKANRRTDSRPDSRTNSRLTYTNRDSHEKNIRIPIEIYADLCIDLKIDVMPTATGLKLSLYKKLIARESNDPQYIWIPLTLFNDLCIDVKSDILPNVTGLRLSLYKRILDIEENFNTYLNRNKRDSLQK